MSTTFQATTLSIPGSSDPTKRVNYVNGMILGVDDFIQEATYLLARDRWLAREALGYGTLAGLDVTVSRKEGESDAPGAWQVNVSPGVALTPTGHLVEVPREQCALLDDWLIANHEKVHAPEGGDPLPLYVVLRYEQCLTDSRPVPGEPCGTQDVYTAKARITDDFALELRVEPPQQVEENAVRAFAAWLATIPVSAGTHSTEALADFVSNLRIFAVVEDPLPDVIEFKPSDEWGTQPPPAALTIPAGHAPEYLRAAFHLWATEFRPAMWETPRPARGTGPGEENVLLAEVRVTLQEGTDTSGNEVLITDPDTEPVVDDATRPLLAHLRMVQEWILHQRKQAENPDAAPLSIELGDAVTNENTFGRPSSVGTSTKVARADHTHGTPPDPLPAHTNDVNAHSLAGDVTGTLGSARVQALQGRSVASNAPTEGNVLRFTNGSWRPAVPDTTTVSGAFVEHPAKAGAYHIVAAGTVEFLFGDDERVAEFISLERALIRDGDLPEIEPIPRLPVPPTDFPPDLPRIPTRRSNYNNLVLTHIDTGSRTVTVTFEGYQAPDFGDPASPQYIVKVTPWLEFGGEPIDIPFAVAMRSFRDSGIELMVIPSRDSESDRGRIMIEVSQYTKSPLIGR